MRYKKLRGKAVLGAAAIFCFAAMVTSGWAVDVGQQPSAFESRQVDVVPNPGYEWSAEHSLARSSNGTLYAVYGGKSLFMATKGPSDTEWSVQIVDTSYRVGKHNSLALDSNGYPHISYATFSENVSLKYARWDGSTWNIETVDGADITDYAGCHNAIAVDGNDRPHIAYVGRKVFPSGAEVRNLMYAYFNGSTWSTEAADADVHIYPNAGYSPLSIAVDSTNTPHISYYQYNRRNATDDGDIDPNDAMYATKNGSAWSTEKVDDVNNSNDRDNSITVDSANTPHMSYRIGNDLMYAKSDGSGGWDTEVVTGTTERGNSIAIGPNDRPQIGYFNYIDDDVMLASYNGSSWDTTAVFAPDYTGNADLSARAMSITVDNNNQAYFLFNESQYGCKVYSSIWDGSAWQTELIDMGGNLAHRNDIVTDKKGFSHVSYKRSGKTRFSDTGYQVEFSELMYARWDGKEWVAQVVDGVVDISTIPADHRNNTYYYQTGQHNSIALDSRGNPHVSYFEQIQYFDSGGAVWVHKNILKYAYWNGTAWVTEELATSDPAINNGNSDYYPFTSIQVDSLDRVHISYLDEHYDGSSWSGNLNHIMQDATGWKTPELVDDCGGNWCGNWSDLALDSMDRPHMSYNDEDDGLLMYAYWDGTAWQKTMVDDCGGTDYCGKSTSIALTKAGKPCISYRDGGWDDGSPSGTATLRYACLNGSTWQKTEIDTRLGGGDTSLALDRSGTPHITYWDGFYKAPKYATTVVVDGTTYWTTVFVEDRRTLYYYYEYPDWEEQGPKIGQRNAIAVDHMGRVQIVYSHQATNGIMHAGTLRGPYFPWMMFLPAITNQGVTPGN